MSERHPDPETLARYLRGDLPPEEGKEVERHLSGCVSCQRAAAEQAGEGPEGVVKWRGHLFGYEAAFDRAARQASERLSRLFEEVNGAASLAEELLAAPEHRRRQLIRSEARFHALKLCELLEDRSREAWFNDPARAVELARLAVAIAIRLNPEHYGARIVEDARAHAWAYLGNAYRIASDLRRAEEALRTAREHHRRGDEDAFTEAQILSFTASLRNSQGRYEEAAGLLDRAIAIYRAGKDRHQEGKNLILKGMTFGYERRFKEAVRLIRRGLSRIDSVEEPWLQVSARHNLIWYLNESGSHQEALETLERTRRLYLELGRPTHLIRLRWVEGKIAGDLDRLAEAEAALRETRDAFVARGIGFDAALVSLDLAALYARQGRTEEVKRLASEMVPIFESRDVHREALAALLLFKEAAEAERVTLSLLDQIVAYLERARLDPELRFRDPDHQA
jgi:tetratricopeptide (TPR) repeat protein